MKPIAVTLFVCLIGGSNVFAKTDKDSVTVTLFYESYCPDCIEYFFNTFYSAWKSFKGRVLFDLVPFGKAHQQYIDGHWEFHCQHGPKECEANKLHACAIQQACGDKGTRTCDVTSLGHVMDFVYCLLRQPDQLRATNQCAKSSGLDADDILSCAHGAAGDVLLNRYGNQTIAFQPRIQDGDVPTVVINGKYDKRAVDDLVGEICKMRPELC